MHVDEKLSQKIHLLDSGDVGENNVGDIVLEPRSYSMNHTLCHRVHE